MKIEFVTSHTHKGIKRSRGEVLDVSDSELVKLVSRGVAKKHKANTFKKAPPKIESEIQPSIGDTDGPATDK